MRRTLSILAIVHCAAFGLLQEGQAATIPIGEGWLMGVVNSQTDVLYFDFTLERAGLFTLPAPESDDCPPCNGSRMTGSFSGVSTFAFALKDVPFGPGSTYFDPIWTDPTVSRFQIAPGEGAYHIGVSEIYASDHPYYFGVRADLAAVPVPASGILLLGALGSFGVMSGRRRRKLVYPRFDRANGPLLLKVGSQTCLFPGCSSSD